MTSVSVTREDISYATINYIDASTNGVAATFIFDWTYNPTTYAESYTNTTNNGTWNATKNTPSTTQTTVTYTPTYNNSNYSIAPLSDTFTFQIYLKTDSSSITKSKEVNVTLLNKSSDLASRFSATNKRATFSMNLKDIGNAISDNIFYNYGSMVQFYTSIDGSIHQTAGIISNTGDTFNPQRYIFGPYITNSCCISSAIGGASTVAANTFNSYSDYRFKTNITTLDERHTVDNIRVVKYNSVNDNSLHFGVIAHELSETYPELVKGEKDDPELFQSVTYTEIIPILINEIQMLKKENARLCSRIQNIENSNK